ncbi:MAG: SDR family oxidoreductase [Chloroflexota bacterium]|nr:SDR family oxidoreductase [Chloroflexota bacterium]
MTEARKAALVTGSATGIGRATAVELARHGYDVAVNYSHSADEARETVRQCETAGARTLLIRADVSDDADARHMLAEVEAAFGRLDVLVNVAGTTVTTPQEDLDGISVEDWDRIFAVNVKGTFLVTRAAAALLRRTGGASVVNLASIVGPRPSTQPVPYAASKAAIVNMTRTLSRVLAPEVRVNAVAPGWIAGSWMERTLGEHYDRLMERRARQTPLQRVATFEDVAETILNLIEHNHFVTGQTVVVDGGYSATT